MGAGAINSFTGGVSGQADSATFGGMVDANQKLDKQEALGKLSNAVAERASITSMFRDMLRNIIDNYPKR